MSHRRLSATRVEQMREYTTVAGGVFTRGEVEALLGDRDYYHARCPVAAEDVEAAGVTPAHASEWARSAGWRESDGEDWPRSPHPFGLLRLSKPGEKRECTACLFDDGAEDNLVCVARLCNEAAQGTDRAPLDILDEMTRALLKVRQ